MGIVITENRFNGTIRAGDITLFWMVVDKETHKMTLVSVKNIVTGAGMDIEMEPEMFTLTAAYLMSPSTGTENMILANPALRRAITTMFDIQGIPTDLRWVPDVR